MEEEQTRQARSQQSAQPPAAEQEAPGSSMVDVDAEGEDAMLAQAIAMSMEQDTQGSDSKGGDPQSKI